MPYRGIPSKGCQTCRKRKIRCDQRPGTCFNCEKANRECGGYRNAIDMMFLDETEDVARKMKSELTFDFASNPSRSATPAQPMPIKPSALPEQSSKLDNFLDLPPSLEAEATAFFYSHFMLNSPYYENNQALFAALSPVSQMPSLRALHHSIVALGLAGMAVQGPENPNMPLSAYAEAQYLAAISALNLSVSSPDEVKSDQTLFAVMVLTIFETFSLPASKLSPSGHKGVTSLTAWSNHISGAAALLEARGIDQFKTEDGVRLFIQAAIPLTINCMQQSRLVPDIIPSLIAEAKAKNLAHITSAPTPPWRFHEQVSRFANFIARVRQRQFTDLEQILDIASAMDSDMEEVGSMILSGHPYHILTSLSTIQHPDDDILPLGYCHAYSSFASAEMWNGNRTLRLQLNGLIRSVLLMGLTRRPPLFADVEHMMLLQQATDNLRSLSDGIIASVPQYLGYIPVAEAMAAAGAASHLSPDSAGTTPSSTTSDAAPPAGAGSAPRSTSGPSKPLFLWSAFPLSPPLDLGALPLVRSAGGCHLPWALMTAAVTDVASPETHAWAVKWLDITARQCHIAQATALARKLREGSLQEGWWRGVCPKDGGGWRPEPASEGGPSPQLS